MVRDIENWKIATEIKHEKIVQYLLVEINPEDGIENLCQDGKCDKKEDCTHCYRPKLT